MTSLPLAPPPELVEDWIELAKPLPKRPPNPGELATLAAQWGADQELEACCLWMERNFDDWDNRFSDELRAARRPKPPSLKEQALEQCNDYIDPDGIIRRALEQLND
jgi:hypothetical protein